MRTALSQKAQAALLAKEQVAHLTASLSQITQLRASLTHNSSSEDPLQEKLAAMRYSLMQFRNALQPDSLTHPCSLKVCPEHAG